MRNTEEKRLQSVVAIVCATLFAVFSFLFVAVYQAPLLEAFYNEVARGKLNFNPYLVGVVVSLMLTGLALWLNRFTKFRREWTALAYLPSSLLLAFITDIDRSLYVDGRSYVGWWIIAIIGIIVYVTLSFFASKLLFAKIKNVAMTTNKVLWSNFILFTLLICLVGTLSNGEEHFKRETRVMSYYNKGEIDKALNVGIKSDDASRELTVMRSYILAANGVLGEHLFEYPQYYAVNGLLPDAKRTSPLLPDSVYSLLGATPKKDEKPIEFLKRIAHEKAAPDVVKDYYLTALLLEKRLREFYDEISALYGVLDRKVRKLKYVDGLPKHYREALQLYADVAVDPITYRVEDCGLDDRYEAFCAEEAQHSDAFVRGNYVRRYFGDTYWWYFRYSNSVPMFQ